MDAKILTMKIDNVVIEVGKSVNFLKLGFNKACQVCVTEASVSEINALMCSTSIFTKSLVENSY